MTKTKNKFIYILLAALMALVGWFSVSTLSLPEAKAESVGVFTMSPGAKAESGKLTFRVWIDKERLANYTQVVELTHTYYNVIVDGNIDESLSVSESGINYTDWEYNLSESSGFGVVDITINVADKPTTPISVVFGFTNLFGEEIDVFSDTVTYSGVYNSSAYVEELKLQIRFLEKELSEVSAESYANYEKYKAAKDQLELLKAEYETLKNEESIKAWSIIVSLAVIVISLLSGAITLSVKMAKSYAHWFVKVLVILLMFGAITALGIYFLPKIIPIISGLL